MEFHIDNAQGFRERSRHAAAHQWALLIGLVIVLAACGGDSTDTSGNNPTDPSGESTNEFEFAVFASTPGGTATLEVPAGSLPEGVSQDDVQIEAVIPDSTDDSVPFMVIGIAPSGIALSETATLTVTFDSGLPDGTTVIHTSGDTIEFLAADFTGTDTDAGTTMAVRIDHFSILTFHEAPFDATIVASPETVEVEQTQTAAATVTKRAGQYTVPVYFSSDPINTRRTATFSEPRNPVGFESATVSWTDFDAVKGLHSTFEPTTQPVDLTGGPQTWSATTSSVCNAPSGSSPYLRANVTFQVTLIGLSEAVSFSDWALSRAILGQPGAGLVDPGLSLIDNGPGDVLTLKAVITKRAPGSCVAAGTAPETPPEDPPDETGVKDAEWHYRVSLADATANLESITDCDELTALWEMFSFDVGNDDPEVAARALELDDIAYNLRKKLGC